MVDSENMSQTADRGDQKGKLPPGQVCVHIRCDFIPFMFPNNLSCGTEKDVTNSTTNEACCYAMVPCARVDLNPALHICR